MRILLASSEVIGFAKTGGLADVAGSLPRALQHRGHDCAVIMPLYQVARHSGQSLDLLPHSLQVPMGHRTVGGQIWRSKLPGSTVPVFLIEQADYFERDNPSTGRGLYQYTLPGGQKQDYPDNCERFIFFSRVVLEVIRLLKLQPDILHANDWQTGLVPVYLREIYQQPGSWGEAAAFNPIRTLFTIHNIAYQGVFWHWDMKLTGLDWKLFNFQQLEFYGHLNLLKAGIVFADVITTVSPSYAREIQTPYYGCGLQSVLAERSHRLFGIVNGVDYEQWDPSCDPHIAATYDVTTVGEYKPRCKTALQQRYRLGQQARAPLFGMVARLVEQKGVDLVIRVAPSFLEQGGQLVVLGEGDPSYQRALQELRHRYPEQVGLALSFDEGLAHQIEAGADMFLMPSLYEPSGLNQLYSMRYGTVPIVRATGGLADTVVDVTPATRAEGSATGFSFIPYSPEALRETIQRALECYHHDPDQWLEIQRNGMKQDWSWNRSAAEYERLYESLVRGT